jgi:hypothetical protein
MLFTQAAHVIPPMATVACHLGCERNVSSLSTVTNDFVDGFTSSPAAVALFLVADIVGFGGDEYICCRTFSSDG